MCRPARLGALLAALLVLSAAAAPGAADAALTRRQADALAARVLDARGLPGRAVLFGLPRPLTAGTYVFEANLPDQPQGTRTGVVRPLRRGAWLYWLDRGYEQLFQHPSTVLLLDARTGRVTARRAESWFPLVNGRRPAFLASAAAYRSPRFHVAESRGVATARGSRAAPTRARAAKLAPADLSGDCMVTIGDRAEPILKGSFTAMEGWADRVGLRRQRATTKSDLETEIGRFVAQGCRDVLLFIAGHGNPPAGITAPGPGGGTLKAAPPAVNLGERLELDPKTGRVTYANETITPDDLAALLKRFPSTEFKVKIESCFSGRFAPVAKQAPNLRVLELSSGARQFSYGQVHFKRPDGKLIPANDNPTGAGEFTNGDVHGLERWAAGAGPFDLADGLQRSVTLGRDFNWGITSGKAVPVVAENPPLASFTTRLELSWRHLGDTSEVCVRIVTEPPQPGALIHVTLTGPGVGGTGEARIEMQADGTGRARFPITRYGRYAAASDGTPVAGGAVSTGAGAVDVTSAPGTCPAP